MPSSEFVHDEYCLGDHVMIRRSNGSWSQGIIVEVLQEKLVVGITADTKQVFKEAAHELLMQPDPCNIEQRSDLTVHEPEILECCEASTHVLVGIKHIRKEIASKIVIKVSTELLVAMQRAGINIERTVGRIVSKHHVGLVQQEDDYQSDVVSGRSSFVECQEDASGIDSFEKPSLPVRANDVAKPECRRRRDKVSAFFRRSFQCFATADEDANDVFQDDI